jgi:hypothetical protein
VGRITALVMTTDSALSRHDGRHDFDFLHGRWHSRQRKLRKRLANCQDWDEFTADLHCQPVLGGPGNFDELASPAMTYTGLALRLYDHPDDRPLGPGVLGRQRGDLGDELDGGLQPASTGRLTSTHSPDRCCQKAQATTARTCPFCFD